MKVCELEKKFNSCKDVCINNREELFAELKKLNKQEHNSDVEFAGNGGYNLHYPPP